MDGLSHHIIAAKGEGNIAQSPRCADTGQMFVYPSNRLDEIDRIVAVFLNTGANSENVGVKNDVAWFDSHCEVSTS